MPSKVEQFWDIIPRTSVKRLYEHNILFVTVANILSEKGRCNVALSTGSVSVVNDYTLPYNGLHVFINLLKCMPGLPVPAIIRVFTLIHNR